MLLKTSHQLARIAGARNWDLGEGDMPTQMARILVANGVTIEPPNDEVP